MEQFRLLIISARDLRAGDIDQSTGHRRVRPITERERLPIAVAGAVSDLDLQADVANTVEHLSVLVRGDDKCGCLCVDLSCGAANDHHGKDQAMMAGDRDDLQVS